MFSFLFKTEEKKNSKVISGKYYFYNIFKLFYYGNSAELYMFNKNYKNNGSAMIEDSRDIDEYKSYYSELIRLEEVITSDEFQNNSILRYSLWEILYNSMHLDKKINLLLILNKDISERAYKLLKCLFILNFGNPETKKSAVNGSNGSLKDIEQAIYLMGCINLKDLNGLVNEEDKISWSIFCVLTLNHPVIRYSFMTKSSNEVEPYSAEIRRQAVSLLLKNKITNEDVEKIEKEIEFGLMENERFNQIL